MSTYDIIDEDDQLIGITADYATVHREGLWHRGVHVILYTASGHILIQRRSEKLSLYPGVYEISVGGGVDAGETTEQATIREVYEELGLRIGIDDLNFIGTYKSQDTADDYVSNSIDYCYSAEIADTDGYTLDRNETISAMLVTRAELNKALTSNNQGSFGTLGQRNDLWRLLLSGLPV